MARASGNSSGVGTLFGLFALAVVLGVGLSFLVALIHGFCLVVLKVCVSTTDTTVWSMTYPIVFIPAYWIAVFVGWLSTDYIEVKK